MANLFDIEGRLFAIADGVREQNEGVARKIIAIIADIRAWQQAEREDWYARHSELLRKWNEFSNSTVQEEFQRQKELLETERARILRALAVDPRWQGSYADLAKLTGE
jgi:hypothetical protein